jgi:hypothetical protein
MGRRASVSKHLNNRIEMQVWHRSVPPPIITGSVQSVLMRVWRVRDLAIDVCFNFAEASERIAKIEETHCRAAVKPF